MGGEGVSKTGGGKGTNQHAVKGVAQATDGLEAAPSVPADSAGDAAASGWDPMAVDDGPPSDSGDEPEVPSPRARRKQARSTLLHAHDALRGRSGLSHAERLVQLEKAEHRTTKAIEDLQLLVTEAELAGEAPDWKVEHADDEALGSTDPRHHRRAARLYLSAATGDLAGQPGLSEQEKADRHARAWKRATQARSHLKKAQQHLAEQADQKPATDPASEESS